MTQTIFHLLHAWVNRLGRQARLVEVDYFFRGVKRSVLAPSFDRPRIYWDCLVISHPRSRRRFSRRELKINRIDDTRSFWPPVVTTDPHFHFRGFQSGKRQGLCQTNREIRFIEVLFLMPEGRLFFSWVNPSLSLSLFSYFSLNQNESNLRHQWHLKLTPSSLSTSVTRKNCQMLF